MITDQDRGHQARLSLESFDLFCRRYLPVLERYLVALTSDSSWARDVAQDAMMAACDRWDDLLTYERPDAWLFKVATRRLRVLEAQARERWLPGDPGDGRQAEVADTWVSDHSGLLAALRALPRRQAEVIGLHFLGGYSMAETAAITGVGAGTASTHLRRGLDSLRRQHSGRPVGAGADVRG